MLSQNSLHGIAAVVVILRSRQLKLTNTTSDHYRPLAEGGKVLAREVLARKDCDCSAQSSE